MTLIFPFNGSSGWSVLLNCMSAPSPLADHSFGLTPQPMNMTAKRLGNAGAMPVAAASAGLAVCASASSP